MFFIQYLFLFFILICYLTVNTNQNELLSSNKRIKRFLHSKKRPKTQEQVNIEIEELLNSPNMNDNEAQNRAKTGCSAQDLNEVHRILSKKEDDYYGILNVKPSAYSHKIIGAYKRLSLCVHPDKNKNSNDSTIAFQRLNNAATNILKHFQQQNQSANRSYSPDNDQDETTPVNAKTRSSFSKSLVLTTPKRRTVITKTTSSNNISGYLLLIFIVLIIGIIIFIIYWKKRKHSSNPLTNRNNSKKVKISDSPILNDDDGITMDETSEISITQDDE